MGFGLGLLHFDSYILMFSYNKQAKRAGVENTIKDSINLQSMSRDKFKSAMNVGNRSSGELSLSEL